jgi:hypothetical protein
MPARKFLAIILAGFQMVKHAEKGEWKETNPTTDAPTSL